MTSKKLGIQSGRPRTIGRLAEEAGVHVETIRYYERRGLLRRPPTPPSGWRTYDESAVWIIHYSKLGGQLGFTLAELRKLLSQVGSGQAFCTSMSTPSSSTTPARFNTAGSTPLIRGCPRNSDC